MIVNHLSCVSNPIEETLLYPRAACSADLPGLPGSEQYRDEPRPEPFRGWRGRVAGVIPRLPYFRLRSKAVPDC